MNSISLFTCSSNASFTDNTLVNDAIIITGNSNQKIHMANGYGGDSLLTLHNNTLYINGNCEILGNLIYKNTIINSNTTNSNIITTYYEKLYAHNYNISDEYTTPILNNDVFAREIFIGDAPGYVFNSNTVIIGELYSGYSYPPTANSIIITSQFENLYASSYNISDINKIPIASDGDIYASKIFIGDAPGYVFDSNTVITKSLYMGEAYTPSFSNTTNSTTGTTTTTGTTGTTSTTNTAINATNINSGTLAVEYGGTGTNTKTGTGDLVLGTNPIFDDTIMVNNCVNIVNDSATQPGYSWGIDSNTGMYQSYASNIDFSISGINKMNINNDGLVINGMCKSDIYVTTSDKRIKNNIVDITEGLDIVSRLEPKMYEKIISDISDHTIIESGLIAQDIYTNTPELHHIISVAHDAVIENDYWGSTPASVNYTGLIPYLIQSIKELNIIVANLEAKIDKMKSDN